ncbi:MAG: hypothetical protein ACLU8D_08370 [Enterocloster sp.]
MGIKVNQETLQMIADLSNARGASGFEDETVQAAAKHIGEGYTTEGLPAQLLYVPHCQLRQ